MSDMGANLEIPKGLWKVSQIVATHACRMTIQIRRFRLREWDLIESKFVTFCSKSCVCKKGLIEMVVRGATCFWFAYFFKLKPTKFDTEVNIPRQASSTVLRTVSLRAAGS